MLNIFRNLAIPLTANSVDHIYSLTLRNAMFLLSWKYKIL